MTEDGNSSSKKGTLATDVAETSKENIPSLLNEKQQRFIDECEKEFVTRYTEADPDYKKVSDSDIGEPPIIDPWYCKPKRNFNWSGRREDSRRNDRQDDRRDRYGNRGNDGRDRYRGYGDGGRDRYREAGNDRRYRDRNQYYGQRRNPY